MHNEAELDHDYRKPLDKLTREELEVRLNSYRQWAFHANEKRLLFGRALMLLTQHGFKAEAAEMSDLLEAQCADLRLWTEEIAKAENRLAKLAELDLLANPFSEEAWEVYANNGRNLTGQPLPTGPASYIPQAIRRME